MGEIGGKGKDATAPPGLAFFFFRNLSWPWKGATPATQGHQGPDHKGVDCRGSLPGVAASSVRVDGKRHGERRGRSPPFSETRDLSGGVVEKGMRSGACGDSNTAPRLRTWVGVMERGASGWAGGEELNEC